MPGFPFKARSTVIPTASRFTTDSKTYSAGRPLEGALPFLRFLAIFAPAMAKTYIVTFRSHNDDRPSKFIVVADNMRAAINIAWEKGRPNFQVRFDKSTAQAEQMKEGALRVL